MRIPEALSKRAAILGGLFVFTFGGRRMCKSHPFGKMKVRRLGDDVKISD